MAESESNGFWRPWETGYNGSRCGLMHPPPEKWQEVKFIFLRKCGVEGDYDDIDEGH